MQISTFGTVHTESGWEKRNFFSRQNTLVYRVTLISELANIILSISKIMILVLTLHVLLSTGSSYEYGGRGEPFGHTFSHYFNISNDFNFFLSHILSLSLYLYSPDLYITSI